MKDNFNADIREMGDWIKGYSKERYGGKWVFGYSLGFKWKIKNFEKIDDWMESLKVYMLGLSGIVLFDGIYVGEYRGDGGLGVHSVLYYEGDMSNSECKNRLYAWGKNKGSVDVMKLDEDGGFDYYMSKYLWRSHNNSFNIIGNRL